MDRPRADISALKYVHGVPRGAFGAAPTEMFEWLKDPGLSNPSPNGCTGAQSRPLARRGRGQPKYFFFAQNTLAQNTLARFFCQLPPSLVITQTFLSQKQTNQLFFFLDAVFT